MKALKHTRRAIHNNGFHQNVELIPAKVPILRLNIKNVQIDINCNNLTGLRNTWLLNAYSASSPKIKDVRVKPLAMIIKKAAKLLDVNDPVNGTLSR
jgi:poly(A) RNA polymerase GLD2